MWDIILKNRINKKEVNVKRILEEKNNNFKTFQ